MESPSPLPCYNPKNSKKRVFPGGTSACMEAEVVEISPPPPRMSNSASKSKSLKQKKAIFPEVIDLDLYEDSGDVMLIGDMVVPGDKGKELLGHTENSLKSSTATTSNNSFSKSKLNNVGFTSGLNSSLFSWPLESTQIMSVPGSSSTAGTQLSSLGQAQSSTWSFLEPAPGKGNLIAASGITYSDVKHKDPVNLSSVKKHPKSLHFHSTSHQENETFPGGAMSYVSSQTDFPVGASYAPISIKQHGAYDNSMSNVATSMTYWQGSLNVTGHAVGTSWVSQGSTGPSNAVPVFIKDTLSDPLFNPALASPAATTSEVPSLASSTKVECGPSEVMKRFQVFKKFDTVQDFPDHIFKGGSKVKQPSKNWTKKIQDEWRILEKDLPDTIFVRVCESRMDLLRAVIVGAEGTPYHDGLFFFDVFFPSNYPSVPPKVSYHSGGLRINPNLYQCGKVCLSLLNTWSGSQNEKWIPSTSTMLQVLVSIQGLILNANPYFNEPGFAYMNGSAAGEKSSLQYNENTFILSLKTMVYNMRRPLKDFEDYVAGHFCNRAHDILVACQAYISGAQVGCLVKGGVQDVDEGDKSCSHAFRYDVASFINTLIGAFKQIGANDCEKFLPLAEKAKGQRPGARYPAPRQY